MDKVSYALGIGIGRQLASMGAESLNIDDFAQAVKDAIAGKLQLDEQEAQELVQNFFAEQEAKAQAEAKAFHEAVAEVDVPVVTGLREAPEEAAPSTLSGLDISTLSTDGLTDKAALDDGMYHGNLDDV